MKYGLTNEDILIINSRLEKQREYLIQNDLYNSNYGANIRPDKYIAELYNRVDTIKKFATHQNLKPIFITITAPSQYHPYKTTPNGKQRKNKNYNDSTPAQTAIYLSKVWARLMNTSQIQKYNKYKHYFRTYEPHKDGTPHIHSLLYVEEDYIVTILEAFKKIMIDENIKQYKFIYEFEKSKYYSDDSAAIAYIMKYINKSFKNAKSGEMNDISYWYAKYKIRRFLTSRSLIPLMVYRKINYKDEYQDMFKSTELHNNRQFVKDSEGSISFIEFDYDLQECVETAIFKKDTFHYKKPDIVKISRYEKEEKRLIPYYIDGVLAYYRDEKGNKLKPAQKPAKYLSNQDLLTEFYKMDRNLDNYELVRYGVFKNELISRGLLDGDILSLNLYNTDI